MVTYIKEGLTMRFLSVLAVVFIVFACNSVMAVWPFNSADETITVPKNGTLEIMPGNYDIENLVIPKDVTLKVDNGAVINVKKTLEINGPLDAGVYKIFTGPGKVSGSVKVDRVYPQWFGAVGDGKNDDTEAIQKAADLAQTSSGGLLFIPSGRYRFDGVINIRCDVECKGLLIKEIEIDDSRTEFSYATFCKGHFLKKDPRVMIVPDTGNMELASDMFYGIKENDFKIPAVKSIPLVDGSKKIDLLSGGTLTFMSSDFFSSRNNNHGDEFYDKNDCTQLVSPGGDVYPEFCFSYDKAPDTEEWSADKTYKKGDYCKYKGKIYKATFPTGPGSSFTNTYKGLVVVGPVTPDEKNITTFYNFKYRDGAGDRLKAWRQLYTKVFYQAPQRPLTINGLAVEIYLKNDNGKNMRIWEASTVIVVRSNVTFNNMRVSCMNRNATLNAICSVSTCANLTFNNCYFSGATNHGTGYNILHSNCANITYNNCISTNCRDAMAGRHGKNITVNGGFYNRIDDHYGKNYTIRNVEINALSTFIPGYRTPKADMDNWGFRPEGAFAFAGSNIFIENCRIYNCYAVFCGRGDIGDLYGTITLKDIVVSADKDVILFAFPVSDKFDYAHKVRTPDHVVIENVFINKPNKFKMQISGLGDPLPWQFYIRNCEVENPPGK